MTDTRLEKLRAELDDWRARLDHLRVQANLGHKEARDKLDELGEKLEPAWSKSKEAIEQVVSSGAEEARTLGKSLLAGWEELRRTHRELAQEARRQRADRG
jgi:predicted  nucleic acid-binding Zn-ribbon protein